nr:hypothetical protein [Tanacetum cinerariifolium]
MCLYIDAKEHELGDLVEPANYKAALLDPESDKWLNAMNVKMQSMKDNKVWELVDLPPNGKTINIRTIRILIAIATFYDYEIWHMDVKTAFLNGYLNEEHMQNIPYALAVGSIMCAVRCTRPDVVFAQNITSQFQQNPGDTKRELNVSCYTNDGYLTDADDIKSQTGYVFILNRGDVDWKSTKQRIFVTSSTNAKYIAAIDASKEAVWIRKFISGLGVVSSIEKPINMYCGNTGAIAIAKDHGVTKGARHFLVKIHYLQETIEIGDVKIEKVNTYDNLADPFTKDLAFSKHSELNKEIGIIPASSLMREDCCLVTGLRFGVEHWVDYDNDEDPIPFRRQVFLSSLDGEHITGKIMKTLIDSKLFDGLHDDDAVSLCCVGILQLVFLGVDGRHIVPDWILWLANDRVGWDKYPWDSYVWPTLYSELKDKNIKRWPSLYVSQPIDEVDKKSYSIFGFTWAFKGNLHVARLTPDDTKARYDWWVSSRAYFDGVIVQAGRVPCFLNRQNMFEVPSDFYRDFEQQKRDLEQQKKDFEEMKKKDAEREKNGGRSSIQTQAKNSFFNIGTPTNWQTLMPSQPGSSNWQSHMAAQSATQLIQPAIPLHPCTYNCQRDIPSHMGNPNSQNLIETHPDGAGLLDQNIPNREKKEQRPSHIGGLHTWNNLLLQFYPSNVTGTGQPSGLVVRGPHEFVDKAIN